MTYDISAIRITIAVSVLLHVAALYFFPSFFTEVSKKDRSDKMIDIILAAKKNAATGRPNEAKESSSFPSLKEIASRKKTENLPVHDEKNNSLIAKEVSVDKIINNYMNDQNKEWLEESALASSKEIKRVIRERYEFFQNYSEVKDKRIEVYIKECFRIPVCREALDGEQFTEFERLLEPIRPLYDQKLRGNTTEK